MKKLLLIVPGVLLSVLVYPQITIQATVKGLGSKIIIGHWKDYTYVSDTLGLNMNKAGLKLDSSNPIYFKLYTIEPNSYTPFFVAFPNETITIEKDSNHLTIKGGAEGYNDFLIRVDSVKRAAFTGKNADYKTKYLLDLSAQFFSGFKHPNKQLLEDIFTESVIAENKLYAVLTKYYSDTSKMNSLFKFIKTRGAIPAGNTDVLKYTDRVDFTSPNIGFVNVPDLMMMNNFIRILRTQAVQKDSALANADEYTIENRIIKDLFKESRYRSRLLAYNLYHRVDAYTEYPMQLAEVSDFIADLNKENFNEGLVPVIEKLYFLQLSTIGSLTKGAIAPSFKLPDMKGKMVSLSNFKGKVVYLDMWASWCGPCLKEMPFMEALKKKFNNKPVEMIAISIDTHIDRWLAKIASMKLGGVQLIDSKGSENSKIAKDYKIHGVPHYVLIDKSGRIASAFAPRPSSNVEIEKEINQLLQ